MEVKVAAAAAVVPDALWGQTASGGGTGADFGIVYGGTEFGVGVVIAVDDVRAGTVDGWFGWRTGPDVGTGVVGTEAGKWKGWAGVAGGAERWREGAGACGAAGEGG